MHSHSSTKVDNTQASNLRMWITREDEFEHFASTTGSMSRDRCGGNTTHPNTADRKENKKGAKRSILL